MFRTVKFALAMLVFFKTIDSSQCAQLQRNPNAKVFVTTFKNATGFCMARTSVEFEQEITKNNYHISYNQKLISVDHTLTAVDIYVLEDNSNLNLEIKPFRLDYKLYPESGFYKFHPVPLKWAQARRKCIEEGANLVIVNSQKEADILIVLMTDYPPAKLDNTIRYKDLALVGFHDAFENGEFLTLTGQPLADAGYLKWESGQPNNNPVATSNCGAFNRNGGFNDFPCDVPSTFICEKEIEYQSAANTKPE